MPEFIRLENPPHLSMTCSQCKQALDPDVDPVVVLPSSETRCLVCGWKLTERARSAARARELAKERSG